MTIDWTLEQLQNVIDEIVSGERLVCIQTKDEPRFVVLRYPSRNDIRASEVKMEYLKHKAIKDKFRTEEQLMEEIRARGIWTEADDEIVQDLQEQLEKWRGKLTNPDLTDKAKETIRDAVYRLEEKIYKTEYKKEIILSNSAERKAHQEKYEYLCWLCSRDPETGERLWDNYLTYCRFMNAEFKTKLLTELLPYLRGRKVEEVRYVARSNLWRVNYVIAQKTSTPLFPRAVVDLTPDQTNLAWWSGYYQGIYEMLPEDQPDDRTVNDDEALDKYMEDLYKERSKDRQDAKAQKKYGSKSARQMKEQLIMRDNPDYWDLTYDEVPVTKKGSTDSSLKDEAPVGTRAAAQRTKPLGGSKRFKKPDGE